MEVNRFKHILETPHDIEKSDFSELEKLSELFPYFQIAHILKCVSSQKQNSLFFNDHLKIASLVSTNRQKLKALLNYKQDTQQKPQFNLASDDNISSIEEISKTLTEPKTNNEEIIESTVEVRAKLEEGDVLEETNKENSTPQNTTVNGNQISEHFTYLIHDNIVDNQRLQDAPMLLDEISLFNNQIEQFLKTPTETNIPFDPISNFLNNPPKRRLPNLPFEEEVNEDLSEKFTNNSDEFFSESLAILYSKQAKYQKAIETYHKLILTNPQKSAYFASKILELEKFLE